MLSKTKQQLARVQTEDLPNAMFQVGMREFTLDNGLKIQIEEFVNAHISKENKDEAHIWLAEHGYGDIVKDQVVLTFGRQEHDKAVNAIGYLISGGYHPINSQSVHGQTLKAWAK